VASYYGAKRTAIARLAAQLAPQLLRIMPDPDVVHCARIGREPLAFAALQVARLCGVPFVLAPYHHPRWVGWNYRALHALYRAADGVLALTSVERDELVAHLRGGSRAEPAADRRRRPLPLGPGHPR
jgi:hypothetical protein